MAKDSKALLVEMEHYEKGYHQAQQNLVKTLYQVVEENPTARLMAARVLQLLLEENNTAREYLNKEFGKFMYLAATGKRG